MTIARRLIILLALPLLVLVGLGVFVRTELARIETHTRFLAETQVVSLTTLGNLSRTLTEMRVNVRNYLLTENKADLVRLHSAFDQQKAEALRLLRLFADTLVTDARDRRLLNEYSDLSRNWLVGVGRILSLADTGHRDDAVRLMLSEPMRDLGTRLSTVSSEWIQ